MATVQELEAQAKQVREELAKARKADRATANARKRAAKALDRWQSKHVDVLKASEAGIVADLVNGLDPKVSA